MSTRFVFIHPPSPPPPPLIPNSSVHLSAPGSVNSATGQPALSTGDKSKRRAWGVPEETDATRGLDNQALLTTQQTIIKRAQLLFFFLFFLSRSFV